MAGLRLHSVAELIVWLIITVLDVAVCINAPTFYVTRVTFWYGAILLLLTALLFWMKFRPRRVKPEKLLRFTTSILLVIVMAAFLLYTMGVITYYE